MPEGYAIDSVLPSPSNVRALGGTLDVSSVQLRVDGDDGPAQTVAERLRQRWQIEERGTGTVVRVSLDDDVFPTEGYALRAEDGEVSITGGSATGLAYGAETLLALSGDTGQLPAVDLTDAPALPYRAVHLDFRSNCLRPTIPYLRETLQTLARHKVNVAVVEWEDKFPFSRRPELANQETFSTDEVQELRHTAHELGIALVPLLQTLGHVEYVLKHPRHAHLRENANDISQFCPSEPGSTDLLFELMDELMEASPDGKFIHLGGDETWLLGSCPRCAARVGDEGLLGLYVDHMSSMAKHALDAGRIPMIWGDIVLGRHVPSLVDGRWPEESLRVLDRMPKETRMVYWDYHGTTPADFTRFEDYKRLGHSVWVAPTTRSSDVLPDYATHLPNISSLLQAGQEHDAEGAFITSWAWKNMPEELTWHGLLTAAERAWSGSGLSQEQLDLRASAAYFGRDIPEFVEAIYLLSYDYWDQPYQDDAGHAVRSSYLTLNPGHEFMVPDPQSVRERALRAVDLLHIAHEKATKHPQTLRTWIVAAELIAHMCLKQTLFSEFDAIVANPGRQLNRVSLADLRQRLEELAAEREQLAERWSAALRVNNIESSVVRDGVLRFGGERWYTTYAVEQLAAFEVAEGRRLWR
jgi:Glycosyl hydrolase family 20, domain 2/Glycosyl hydrolase family 20, catalytic domain